MAGAGAAWEGNRVECSGGAGLVPEPESQDEETTKKGETKQRTEQ